MNPLTLVKRIQNINAKEASLGISEDASWHAKYKDSAYVFVGGIPFDLTEGDLLAVFAQYVSLSNFLNLHISQFVWRILNSKSIDFQVWRSCRR